MSQYDSLTARTYAWFCLQIVGCTTVSLWTCWVEMGTWVTWLHFLKRQRITVNSLWSSKLVCSAVALLHSHVERPSPACCPYALYPSLPDTGCEVHKRAECRSQAWRWWDKIFSVENCASEIRNAVGLQGLLVILCDQACPAEVYTASRCTLEASQNTRTAASGRTLTRAKCKE